MKKEENIIAIRNRNIHDADLAFADFMKKTEACFNERSQADHKLYKGISSDELERQAVGILKEVAPSTPFNPDNITLVAGHSFPDIMAETYYGVEVKSTKEDKWTSTGSSIVESTRNKFVDNIYMLFGKLGSTPPEFKLRPYQECLSNIAVTHSPRYLIDMTLSTDDNIFCQMKTEYDSFRLMNEKDKISKVRHYFIQKARKEGKLEMPWWMGESTSVNLSFYNDLNKSQKSELMIRCYVIFFSMYDNNQQYRYKSIALWLCNHYSLLCPNIRDSFTAGGTCSIKVPDGKIMTCPHIVGELLEKISSIKKLLDNPDADLIKDIDDFWDFDYDPNNLFDSWLTKLEDHFRNNNDLKKVPIRLLLEKAI